MEERALPDSVFGPVAFWALRRLAKSWASERGGLLVVFSFWVFGVLVGHGLLSFGLWRWGA